MSPGVFFFFFFWARAVLGIVEDEEKERGGFLLGLWHIYIGYVCKSH